MGYRIAYSTNAYTKVPLIRAVEEIRRIGFDGVEILADTPHAFPPYDDDEVEALKLATQGFPISNVNGNTFRERFNPSLIDPDAKSRRERIAYTKWTIDLARELGAECVCTSTGRLPKGLSSEQAMKHLSESLEKILAHADRKPKVRVGLEAEPGFFVGNLSTLRPVLEAVPHPLLGANLDLGHSACSREDLAETIEAIGPKIWNIHIEDIKDRVHEHLIPGLGSIDFGQVRKALDRIKYKRLVTLEIYPYKDDPSGAGRKSLDVLRKFFS